MHSRLRSLLVAGAAALAALAAPSTASATVDPGWIHWVGPTGDQSEAWVRSFDSFGIFMYAGTEGDGVYRSSDNGLTWSKFSTNLQPGYDSVRAIDAGATTVTIGTDSGLYTSSNGGAWQPLGQGVGANKLNGAVQTFISGPVPGFMLAGVVGGIFRSSDGGETWQPSSTGLPPGTTAWSLDRFTWLPGRILAATSSGAYQSLDSGASWSPVMDGLPTGTNILRVVADQQNPLIWYAITSGEGVYKSTTGGLTWAPANTGLGADLQTRAITLLPVAPAYSDVIIGTQNGLYSSIDKGAHWKKISNTGLGARTITWAITTLPNLPFALLAGMQGNGVNYRLLSPPINTASPALSDTSPTQGTAITTNNGTWEGTETITYEYQWQRCTTASPASCSDIDGATAQSYTPELVDVNKRLRAVVKAENAATPAGYTSTDAGNEPTPLSSLVAVNPGSLAGSSIRNNPTVTVVGGGQPVVSAVLTAAANTWIPAPTTFGYQWYRGCTLGGTGCEPIPGATGQTHALVDADVPGYVGVVVSGTNLAGTAFSDVGVYGSEILPRQVVKQSDPKVNGKPWVGQALVRSLGSYSGPFENSFTTWQACDDAAGTSCSTISFSSTPTFTLNNGQRGKFIRVKVEIDVNGFLQIPATLVVNSTTIGPVGDAPAKVANTVAPKVVGVAAKSVALTISRGSWTGGPTFTQRWLRCNAAGASCAAIAGATGASYTLGTADVGSRVAVDVTGINAWGEPVTARSAPTAVVVATIKPTYQGGGKITGVAKVGRKLTAKKGLWAAAPAAAFTYQWTRNGAKIAGAKAATYKLRAADKGKKVGCVVTAKNAAGKATQKLAARKVT